MIEKYEIKAYYRIEGEPTGNFIVVDLSYWMYHDSHNVKVLAREEEADHLPNLLMVKIKRNHYRSYLRIKEEHEIERIRAELDNALPKPNQ